MTTGFNGQTGSQCPTWFRRHSLRKLLGLYTHRRYLIGNYRNTDAVRWRGGKWWSPVWLSSWYSEKQASVPFPFRRRLGKELEGFSGDFMKGSPWGTQCESKQTIRSPSEHLSSETHPGSHPSSDIPALFGFGQAGFPLCTQVSLSRKQENSTYHVGRGEDWTGQPVWKHLAGWWQSMAHWVTGSLPLVSGWPAS